MSFPLLPRLLVPHSSLPSATLLPLGNLRTSSHCTRSLAKFLIPHSSFLILLVACLPLSLRAEGREGDARADTLRDVVVTGTRTTAPLSQLSLTVSSIDRQALTESYQTNVLPTLCEQVPGLMVTTRGVLGYGVSTGAAGTIKIRGIGGSAALLTLVDGEPQYAGLYGHPIADALQTLVAERVEVVRGPASTLYGTNAMGGVVNILTRQGAEGWHGHLTFQGGSYGTLQGAGSAQVRQGPFAATAALSYGRTDGHRANSDFEQTTGFLKLSYALSPHWSTNAHLNLTHFNSANPGEVAEPMLDNDMCITRGTAALALVNHYAKSDGALRAYYNWGHHHIDDGYSAGEDPQTAFYLHDDRMAGVSAYQSAQLFAGNQTTLGADFQHFGGKAWNTDKTTGERTYLVDRTENEVALYIDLRQSLCPRLTLDAALRWDHHSQSGTEWVPAAGLTYRPGPHTQLCANVSKGFRNPTIRELYMFRPANAELKSERLWNYELAWRQDWLDGRLTTALNLFYLNADNLISTEMVDGSACNVNTGHTEHSGVEVEAHYSLAPAITLQANYSFLHMSNPQSAAPEHKLLLAARCEAGRLALRPALQYLGKLHTESGDEGATENVWLLSLTADYRLARGLKLFVRGDNLLAQRYETIAGFPMPRATIAAGIDWQL